MGAVVELGAVVDTWGVLMADVVDVMDTTEDFTGSVVDVVDSADGFADAPAEMVGTTVVLTLLEDKVDVLLAVHPTGFADANPAPPRLTRTAKKNRIFC